MYIIGLIYLQADDIVNRLARDGDASKVSDSHARNVAEKWHEQREQNSKTEMDKRWHQILKT